MKKKTEYIELIFLYFKFRNLFDYGFQKYNFYKNLISYVCDLTEYGLIRRLFEDLNKRSVFTIKYSGNTILYCFNPTNRKIENKIIDTINWQ